MNEYIYAIFTSSDRLERMSREGIAAFLEVEPNDARLTDEVCYATIENWSLTNNVEQTVELVREEYPQLRP